LEGKEMHIYICSKCGAVVEKDSMPAVSGCPKGTHSWSIVAFNGSLVAKPGLHPYQCRNCGILIYSDSMPFTVSCHFGGTHSWIKL